MKFFKTKLRYSGVIYKDKPIEQLDPEELRRFIASMPRKTLGQVVFQMVITLNRLWDIYNLKESDIKLEAALSCVRLLITAYAKGEANGGAMEWSDVDEAYEKALEVEPEFYLGALSKEVGGH